MYTVEMDHDEIKIIIIDDHNREKELEVYLYDDQVIFKQYFDEDGYPDVSEMIITSEQWDQLRSSAVIPLPFAYIITSEQWDQLRSAMESPEGCFYRKRR